MLRPAVSPCRAVAHATFTAPARSRPAAGRAVHMAAAAASPSQPALEAQTKIDSAAIPTASPGTEQPPSRRRAREHPRLTYSILSPPDARFDVLGTPFSLLSVALSASQTLYTRRGTLVSLTGKPENTVSTLSVLEPIRRAPVGIPFLYQKISSTSPVTALVSTKSPISSIVSVHLDGRQDWIISQRQALLAWTGHSLALKPQYNAKLGLAHWGNTYITGRGLLALAGSGQIYQVQVKEGESYVAHPSHVVAYTASLTPPQPFRFPSSHFRMQLPDLGFGTLLQRVRFFRVLSETATWKALASTYHTLKTWMRKTIWGDRLFLRFEGPATMLLQSRASRISDALSLRDVNEIADSAPGAVDDAVSRKINQEMQEIASASVSTPAHTNTETLRYATIKNGKAEFERPSA